MGVPPPAPDGGPDIVVAGLSKAYGSTTAVADVSFDVPRGAIFGLLGPNGSGKTTTVECLQGLRRPDGGSLRVLGIDPTAQGDRLRRRIGSQLQDSALPERITVEEAVRLFATTGGGARSDVSRRVGRTIEEWGLAPKRRARFGTLSGGQRQRLFIALALVNDPEVVFLDEMTTGLDPSARREAWELVARVRDRGTTVLLVTHFMDEAERLCDTVAVLVRGRVAATGTPGDLVARYAGETTVSVDMTQVLPDGRAQDPHEQARRTRDVLAASPGVRECVVDDVTVRCTGDASVLPWIGHALVEHGWQDATMRVSQHSLETAYLRITEEDREP